MRLLRSSFPVLGLLIALSWFGPGCGDEGEVSGTVGGDGDATTQADGTSPGGGCVPVGEGAAGTVSGVTRSPLASGNADVQGSLDDWGSALPGGSGGLAAASSCGTFGVLYRMVGDGGDSSVAYRHITKTVGDPEILPGLSASMKIPATLMFDANCRAAVATASAQDGYLFYARSEQGEWTVETTIGTEEIFGDLAEPFQHRWGTVEADGTMVVVGTGASKGTPNVVVGRLSPAEGQAWKFRTFPAPSGGMGGTIVSGPDEALHALYTKTSYPCDPCDLGLYYGRLGDDGPSGSATWSEELVQKSQWGDPDDRFATNPSLAVAPDGRPVVAASYQTRVITGSLKSSELRVYARTNGKWCYETVATTPDGYQGGDGAKYTGALPYLTYDMQGRPHVLFTDMSQWHDGNGWSNGINGQLRHAVRSDDGWKLATLLSQKGQSASNRPLEGFGAPSLAVSPDGSAAVAVGEERIWDTDSIYNDQPRPMQYNAVVLSFGL